MQGSGGSGRRVEGCLRIDRGLVERSASVQGFGLVSGVGAPQNGGRALGRRVEGCLRVGLRAGRIGAGVRVGLRFRGHLREAVKHHELACENLALRVTLRHEHDLADQILVQGWG